MLHVNALTNTDACTRTFTPKYISIGLKNTVEFDLIPPSDQAKYARARARESREMKIHAMPSEKMIQFGYIMAKS